MRNCFGPDPDGFITIDELVAALNFAAHTDRDVWLVLIAEESLLSDKVDNI